MYNRGISGIFVEFGIYLNPLKRGFIIVIYVQVNAIIVYSLLIEDSIDDTIHRFVNLVLVITVVSFFGYLDTAKKKSAGGKIQYV